MANEPNTANTSTTIINVDRGVNKYKVILIIILFLIGLIGAFFMGRKTIVPQEPEVKYIKGDSIKIEVQVPVEKLIKKPIDTLDVIKDCVAKGKYYEYFPERIKEEIITKQDTSLVLSDWATERFYEETLFDIDTVGKATVKLNVQYNRLGSIEGTFTPISKVVVEPRRIKKFSPFIGGGFSIEPSIDAIGGMFFEDKYGFGVRYDYSLSDKQHNFGGYFLVKF